LYWNRRIEQLRKIYAERQQYLNPMNGKRKYYDLNQIKGIIAKITDIEKRLDSLPTIEVVQKIVDEILQKKGQNSPEMLIAR
jgi:hypothetical protein